MVRIFISLFLSLFMFPNLYAAQSTVTESEGYACLGEDKSMKETERAALLDAKDKAAKNAMTYIKTETKIKDLQTEKDIIEAYNNAAVVVDKEIEKGWYNDPSLGRCYKIRIRANVIPDENAMKKSSQETIDNPSAPLNVQIWTDKKEYKQGDKIKIYLKGNKPFFAKVLYKDVRGEMLQLLPNPKRSDNYFNGGVIYELPSGNDSFELEVSPPFGEENIIVYASASQLGDIDVKKADGVYQVKTEEKDIGSMTRAVTIKAKPDRKKTSAAEVYEEKTLIKTKR